MDAIILADETKHNLYGTKADKHTRKISQKIALKSPQTKTDTKHRNPTNKNNWTTPAPQNGTDAFGKGRFLVIPTVWECPKTYQILCERAAIDLFLFSNPSETLSPNQIKRQIWNLRVRWIRNTSSNRLAWVRFASDLHSFVILQETSKTLAPPPSQSIAKPYRSI